MPDEALTALMKNFSLTERINLMFRAEAVNIINHPNCYCPLNAWDSAVICGSSPFAALCDTCGTLSSFRGFATFRRSRTNAAAGD